MIRIVRLLILESILDNDCQAHDDDRHEDMKSDNEISDSGHFFPLLATKNQKPQQTKNNTGIKGSDYI